MPKSNYNYKNLLKQLIQNVSTKTDKSTRFEVPKAEIIYEGRTTIIKNFDKIIDTINRDADHVMKYLLRELGTAGEKVGNRAVFQGNIPEHQIQKKINDYVETYVICEECGRPDTHLVKEGRTVLLRCDACGAFRPVRVRKKKIAQEPIETLEEGKEYEVTIKDIGKRGDGAAFYGKYIIYVPGAVKGSTVKIRIEKISGTVAFGKIV
ncbi:MAG TPA: translation initiation factor IF-2 subunit beta [Thermoplasmatales archaeon]|nr:translation initiation factor IF-2 subunit beta [Thermoplasmatales archaeon]